VEMCPALGLLRAMGFDQAPDGAPALQVTRPAVVERPLAA
jgi:hypothetical protein